MTTKQREVLDFIIDYYKANNEMPRTSFVANSLGYNSGAVVRNHINRLIRDGYITKQTKYTINFDKL